MTTKINFKPHISMPRAAIVTLLLLLSMPEQPISLAQAGKIGLKTLSKEWKDSQAYTKPLDFTDTALNLEATSFTIGGWSSGGYMTANLFTMFSDSIDGAAINSGSGPCANTGYSCKEEKIINYPTAGMKNKPVFFYSGVKDPLVLHEYSKITSEWFEMQGIQIKRRWINDFVHTFPNSVTSNLEMNPPFSCGMRNPKTGGVQNCGYNMAGEVFTHVLGLESMERIDEYQDHGSLYAIDQRPYNTKDAKLADEGFLYIPTACQTKSCPLHVEFHGCLCTVVIFGDIYIRQLGYLEYAAKNDIIMLFP